MIPRGEGGGGRNKEDLVIHRVTSITAAAVGRTLVIGEVISTMSWNTHLDLTPGRLVFDRPWL